MHLQTLNWRPLSKQSRDKKLIALGIVPAILSELRALEPRQRIIKAAQIALEIDEEPNADLIDYIAGYRARARVYYYFRNMRELMEVASLGRKRASLKPIKPKPSEIDLASPSLLSSTIIQSKSRLRRTLKCLWFGRRSMAG